MVRSTGGDSLRPETYSRAWMGQVASGSLMFTTNELIVIAGLLVVAYLLMGWVGVVLVVVAVWVWDKTGYGR